MYYTYLLHFFVERVIAASIIDTSEKEVSRLLAQAAH